MHLLCFPGTFQTRMKQRCMSAVFSLFSRYFPNKDIADERVGNFYTNLFKNSSDVAKHFESDLLSTATDISNWHSSVFTPNGLSSSNNGTKVSNKSFFQNLA